MKAACEEAERRRDMALDVLDALERLPLAQSAAAWALHVAHINSDGNDAPACAFCQIRVDLDFQAPEEAREDPTGGRDGRTRERTMLDDIFGSLDGEEWDSDTTAEIAQVFTDNGWEIHAPGYYEEEDEEE